MSLRIPTLKSLFVSVKLTFDAAVAAGSLVALWRGAGEGWLGPLATTLPFLALLGWAYGSRRVARTSAGLAWLSMLAVSGVLWSAAVPSGRGWPLRLAAVGLTADLVYLYWYSRLERRGAPLLAQGQLLPDFEAMDEAGARFDSRSLLGRPAVLLFYRGNWCPFCVAQVSELAASYRALEQRGARVVLVSPQPAGHTRALAERFGVPMRFLVDEGSRVARQLGILHEGGLPAGLQLLGYHSDSVLPTAIVTDAAGRILLLDATDNYRVRPEPATFLAALDTAPAMSSTAVRSSVPPEAPTCV